MAIFHMCNGMEDLLPVPSYWTHGSFRVVALSGVWVHRNPTICIYNFDKTFSRFIYLYSLFSFYPGRKAGRGGWCGGG
jgi:hypothetical protein